jgi:hypothetical protein
MRGSTRGPGAALLRLDNVRGRIKAESDVGASPTAVLTRLIACANVRK